MKKSNLLSKMIHKIIFLRNVAGSEIEESRWEALIETYAEVKPVCDSGFILLEGMQFGNIITEEYFLFKTRFINGLDKTMRINFHNQIFEIKRIIDEDSKSRMLTTIALKI